MTTETGARSVGGRGTGHDRHGMTLSQKIALALGATLLLVGLLGFIADATFDTGLSGADDDGGNQGGALQGDSFLGFEVNGWHNVVHILSGLFLLSVFRKHKTARNGLIAFGVIYAIVTIIGLIDGNDVVGLLPVNAADNVLHLVLSALAIGVGLKDKHEDEEHGYRATAR